MRDLVASIVADRANCGDMAAPRVLRAWPVWRCDGFPNSYPLSLLDCRIHRRDLYPFGEWIIALLPGHARQRVLRCTAWGVGIYGMALLGWQRRGLPCWWRRRLRRIWRRSWPRALGPACWCS